MSSDSFADLMFVLELRQRIDDCQTELTKVMNDPNRSASERDALIGSIAELKKVLTECTCSMRHKRNSYIDKAHAN